MERAEQRIRLGLGLALQELGHQRGRRGRNRAAAALERDVVDDALVRELEVDRDLVAAQRVVALGRAVGVGRMAEIARPLAVVEDDFLIEVAEVRHQANSSLTFLSAATSASASSVELYIAKEARAVAAT